MSVKDILLEEIFLFLIHLPLVDLWERLIEKGLKDTTMITRMLNSNIRITPMKGFFIACIVIFFGGFVFICLDKPVLHRGDTEKDVLNGTFEDWEGTITFYEDGTVVRRGHCSEEQLWRIIPSQEENKACSFHDFLLDKTGQGPETVAYSDGKWERPVYELKGEYSVKDLEGWRSTAPFTITWHELNGIPFLPDYSERETTWFIFFNIWNRKYEICDSGDSTFAKVYKEHGDLSNKALKGFCHLD